MLYDLSRPDVIKIRQNVIKSDQILKKVDEMLQARSLVYHFHYQCPF